MSKWNYDRPIRPSDYGEPNFNIDSENKRLEAEPEAERKKVDVFEKCEAMQADIKSIKTFLETMRTESFEHEKLKFEHEMLKCEFEAAKKAVASLLPYRESYFMAHPLEPRFKPVGEHVAMALIKLYLPGANALAAYCCGVEIADEKEGGDK